MRSKYILPIFLFFQLLVSQLILFFPEYVERYYSNGLYPKIAILLRNYLGKTTFSVGDCCYVVLSVLLLYWFWDKRKTWKTNRKDNIMEVLSFISVFYFLFHILWGYNYSREALFEKMSIKCEYSDADLLTFTKKLIAKTNAIQFQITNNDTVKIDFPYSQEQVFKWNLNGYTTLASVYPFFKYSDLCIKKSFFSLPLTYMGFGGYLNPFTNEAQVNYLVPMYTFPAITCHEMAHQMGYASESECNFIGFLASIKNKNRYFQYSGYSMALRYCLGNWKIKNPAVLKQLLQTIHPGILKNFMESELFWRKYETPIATGFKIFYDTYLKLNQQKDGIDSYSKFVDLMVNYYKNQML